MSRLSSRDSVHFTGCLSSHAAKRGLGLVGHVLLAAERAAVGDQLDRDRCRCRRPAPPRSGRGRPTRPGRRSTRAGRRRDGARPAWPPARGTPARPAGSGTPRARHAPTTPAPRRRRHAGRRNGRARCCRCPTPPARIVDRGNRRIGDRRQHVVVDLDQRRRRPGVLARVGHHHRQDVAQIRRAAADRDHDRPVLVDDPDPQVARDVGRGECGHHAGGGQRGADVDGPDVGPGVGRSGAARRAACPAPAGRRCSRGRPTSGPQPRTWDPRLPIPPGIPPPRASPPRDHLDGVEDFHIPRAAAEVGAQMPGHLLAGQGRALLVDLGLGPHHDPRDAEAALQPAARREGLGEAAPAPPRGGPRPSRSGGPRPWRSGTGS